MYREIYGLIRVQKRFHAISKNLEIKNISKKNCLSKLNKQLKVLRNKY